MRKPMTIHYTCQSCHSGNEVYPQQGEIFDQCHVCQHVQKIACTQLHEESVLKDCPICQRQDFYQQKDFNRKIGVILFIIAAIFSIWTYGISLIVLYLFDLLLFSRLGNIAICYQCQTIFRNVKNIAEIPTFDHEINDRIVYSGHDFKGKAP